MVRNTLKKNNLGRASSLAASAAAASAGLTAAWPSVCARSPFNPAPRFFSMMPLTTATARARMIPQAWIGMMVRHKAPASMPRTVAARMVGPAQGIRFSTPMESTAIRSMVVGRICILL